MRCAKDGGGPTLKWKFGSVFGIDSNGRSVQ